MKKPIDKSLYVKIRNALYPGYGECSKCGGNWGWKKYITHATSADYGLFLFCAECDKSVTTEERWKALDEWKKDCILQMSLYPFDNIIFEEVKRSLDVEFMEYPR